MKAYFPTRSAVGFTAFVKRLGYASGNLGKNVIWTSFESFLLYYLINVAGMMPLAAGALLAAAMIWDGLVDVLIACWADSRGRPGALGRMILLGAPLCAAGFVAIFALPAGAQHIDTIAAVMVCRMGYSLCDVGHNTLLVRVATTPQAASSVSGLRLIFSALGAGIVGLSSSHSLEQAMPDVRHAAFLYSAWGGGALYLVTLFAAMLATRGLPSIASGGAVSSRAGLYAIWRNRAFRQVLAIMMVQSCMVPLFMRALPFFGQAVMGDAGWAGRVLMLVTIVQALYLPVWMALGRRHPSMALLSAAHAMMILAMVCLVWSNRGLVGTAALLMLGVAQGGMNMAIWALLPLSLRQSGPSGSEALPVGLFLAGLKSAAGLGQLIFAAIIAWGSLSAKVYHGLPSSALLYVVPSLTLAGSVAVLTLSKRASQRFSKDFVASL